MGIGLRIMAVAAGVALVVTTALSAVRAFVVPRASPVAITRFVFVALRWVFGRITRHRSTYAEKDETMALFAPLGLLLLPGAWLGLVLAGYTAIFWGIEHEGLRTAFTLSSSSLTTLGFAKPTTLVATAVAVTQAMMGLGLLALLITYLPAIYSAFSRRETAVALLDVRAGNPPSAVEMIWRFHAIHGLERLDEVWGSWEEWFADIEESHTSLAALPLLRSPRPGRSWITAAGAVLDAASMRASTLDLPRSPEAELCIRSGFLALRHISNFYTIPYDPDPSPTDPISVTRAEWDEACARLQDSGVPVKSDREQAWRSFQGWRVNYDTVLRALAGLTMAPTAPWSADRALPYRRPPLTRRGGRGRA